MNKKIIWLNVLAITAVVLNHAAHWGFTSIFWWAHRFRSVTSPNFDQVGSLTYWGLSAILQLTIFSVPAFLFVSGFFAAYAAKGENRQFTWKMVRSRVVYILIPYIIWSFIIFGGDYLRGRTYTLGEYVRRLLVGDAVDAFFFVPLLIQFYLLAPILIKFSRKNWKLTILTASVIQLGSQAVWYVSNYLTSQGTTLLLIQIPKWAFPKMILFFVFGIVFGLHVQELMEFLSKHRWLLFTILVSSIFVGLWEYNYLAVDDAGIWVGDFFSISNTIFAFVFIACYFAFDNIPIPMSALIRNIGSRTYGIYLTHVPILEFSSKVIYHIAPFLFTTQVFFVSILGIIGVGLPYAVMELFVKAPTRPYFRYVFG